MLDAQLLVLDLIRTLRPLVDDLATRAPDLADQVRRAATSTALNTAEGNRREGRDRHARFRIAAGECDEAASAVRIAVAWAYVDAAAAAPALALADRLAALLYRLRHPRR